MLWHGKKVIETKDVKPRVLHARIVKRLQLKELFVNNYVKVTVSIASGNVDLR